MSICTKERNKYDLTSCKCFRLAHSNDWSRWFAISSSPPICSSTLSFYGWGYKKNKQLKLDMKNIFAGSHTYILY